MAKAAQGVIVFAKPSAGSLEMERSEKNGADKKPAIDRLSRVELSGFSVPAFILQGRSALFAVVIIAQKAFTIAVSPAASPYDEEDNDDDGCNNGYI
ncbi:hypothetical protein M3223_21205 [Paenibacillus pasadenensis]|uniref:hypothetical protein n=1 Tax=Paenibacillus pasadenensis TaxID=217090 RepID=UPI002041D662|nr:hypothetical protein [Paenibacillus pasadenensis]MCM3749855.1 hypothetical protein [Paenibacillus pasadenensis]